MIAPLISFTRFARFIDCGGASANISWLCTISASSSATRCARRSRSSSATSRLSSSHNSFTRRIPARTCPSVGSGNPSPRRHSATFGSRSLAVLYPRSINRLHSNASSNSSGVDLHRRTSLPSSPPSSPLAGAVERRAVDRGRGRGRTGAIGTPTFALRRRRRSQRLPPVTHPPPSCGTSPPTRLELRSPRRSIADASLRSSVMLITRLIDTMTHDWQLSLNSAAYQRIA